MKRVALTASAVLTTVLLTSIATSQNPSIEFQQRSWAMQAEHERRAEESAALAAEMQAEFKRRPGETLRARHERIRRQMKARHERLTAEVKANFESGGIQRTPWQQPQPTFDPTTAPSPALCLKAYIAATAKAESLEEIFNFLPRRQRSRLQDPTSLTRGTVWATSEAARDQANRIELKTRKDFARRILEVLSVKLDGNKAVLMVSTDDSGRSDSVDYPYGKARIKMVGENKYWKVETYQDTNQIFAHPPQRQNAS